MTILGQLALWIALLLGVWGSVVGVLGGLRQRPELIRSARRTSYALCGVLIVAAVGLLTALLRHDFNVEYVASYTSRDLPTVYTIAAFYGGQSGSLLFWAVVLSIFAVLAQWLTPRRYDHLMPFVAGVTSAVTAFFVLVTLFASNPFDRLPFTPIDGSGLNPQLQNPGMVVHPPMLYLGYISITIPFAFGVAALVSKRLDTGWLHAIRKWTIVSWLLLSVGITLGMWWAYVELGWGGYWAWDPVENASFLPWLTMTAFLHSVMIQEKRGMLKKWNMVLIMLSFLLSIFGTFITRSGIISSVHSFTQSPVGYYFLAFLVLAIVALGWLLWSRLPVLKAEAQLESMLSREASFLFNNLLLVGIAFSVFWGTMFPMISELVRGTQVTVGPPFFNQVNIPLGLALLALTGIGPLIAWRRASPRNLRRQFAAPVTAGVVTAIILLALRFGDFYAGLAVSLAVFVVGTVIQEFVRGVGARHRLHGEGYVGAFARLVGRNRRRYGGYIVHLGIVTYFLAFAGMAFKKDMEASLKPGESVEMRSPYGHTYTFTHRSVSQYEQLNRFVSAALVEVSRDGERIGLIRSEKRQHFTCSVAVSPCPSELQRAAFEPSTEAGIRSDLREDIYVVYAGSVAGTEEAVYRFTINPLVWWVWFGGVILVVGGIVTLWPGSAPTVARRQAVAGYAATLVGSKQ
ncbi:MAG: heme lyase CcmF/NrfE family subunit [Gemmatimonadales bacterium]|nr:heme lyase CcmF/NrfE family subunit [Gemmatimonadales bacterium]NIN48660.1 heme lyase CcmF/NrfE family subunit [Gemmatimonadales bacterium]NIP06124.1 heme lyase CcmF/NrfE family subunit [Gemmatimonadales bacterium]NIR01298.1 heme lyase CcmF/NrfE family subunit [Gemmatimonadales bacterium]